MVQVLSGILSSAFLAAAKDLDGQTKDGVGFFLGAIRIADFLNIEVFKQGVDDFIDHLKASRTDNNIQTVYMPGELEYIGKEENHKHGIEISETVRRDLFDVQRKYGIKHDLRAKIMF